jgi:hypothetical protein
MATNGIRSLHSLNGKAPLIKQSLDCAVIKCHSGLKARMPLNAIFFAPFFRFFPLFVVVNCLFVEIIFL